MPSAGGDIINATKRAHQPRFQDYQPPARTKAVVSGLVMNPGQNSLIERVRLIVSLDAGSACGPVKHFFGPLVQALARQLGGERGLAVNLGADPEHDLP